MPPQRPRVEPDRNGEVVFDEGYFPVLYQVFPTRLDLDPFERYCGRFERFILRGEPFVSLADASAVAERSEPKVRKRLADWSREIEPDLIRLSKGDARVVQSALIRGAMTAVNWLHKTPIAQEWFTTSDDALRWAVERLDAAHVYVPPSLRMRTLQRVAT